MGRDLGSSNFVYESQDLGLDVPVLKCSQRCDVISWLEELGAGEHVSGTDLDLSEDNQTLLTVSGKDYRPVKKRSLDDGLVSDKNKARKLSEAQTQCHWVGQEGTVDNCTGIPGSASDVQDLVQWMEQDAAPEDAEKFRQV